MSFWGSIRIWLKQNAKLTHTIDLTETECKLTHGSPYWQRQEWNIWDMLSQHWIHNSFHILHFNSVRRCYSELQMLIPVLIVGWTQVHQPLTTFHLLLWLINQTNDLVQHIWDSWGVLQYQSLTYNCASHLGCCCPIYNASWYQVKNCAVFLEYWSQNAITISWLSRTEFASTNK